MQNGFLRTSCRLILLALLLPLFSFSNEPEKQPSARTAALGGSSLAIADSWSIFTNQAGLGWQRNFWAGVYHENRYFVKELGYSALGATIPVKPGTFGVNLTHFGYSQYNQSQFGVSYGMILSKSIAAGIGINYNTLHFASIYGSTSCITAEGGIIYQPLDKLIIGAHVFNPSHASLGSSGNLPTSFGIGLVFKPSSNILMTIQGDDNSQSKPIFRTGLEYYPAKSICVRAGMATNPAIFSFGLGWKVKNLIMDVAFSYHEVLGYTPYISLSYTFDSKTKLQDKPEK
jgi:hypothetical protein